MGTRSAVFAAAAFAVLAAGCGSDSISWTADRSSVYIARDGHVESALVYTSERANDLYDQEELAAFVRQTAEDYCAEHGTAPESGRNRAAAEVIACRLDKGTGSVVFAYASPEDFLAFSDETGDDTHTITSLKIVSVDQPKKGCTRIDVSGAGRICTEGKILQFSDSGVTQEDDYTVVTDEGQHYIIFK